MTTVPANPSPPFSTRDGVNVGRLVTVVERNGTGGTMAGIYQAFGSSGAGTVGSKRISGLGCATVVLMLGVFAGTSPSSASDCAGGDDHGNNTSFACGNAFTYGENSVALGEFARAGYDEDSPSDYNIAIGRSSLAMGQSVAMGASALAGDTSNGIEPSQYHIAIGNGAEAGQVVGAEKSIAIGTFTKANASYATAVGTNSTANFTGSTAIGYLVDTTRNNQVAIGNANNTYTLAGVNSQASKDAQGGPVYLMTTDGNGNLAASTFDTATLEGLPAQVSQNTTAISNLTTTVGGHTTELADHELRITNNTNSISLLNTQVGLNTINISQLDGRVDNLEAGFQNIGNQIGQTRTEARAGTALALATAGLRYDDRPGKLSIAGGFGNFKGQSGLAVGLGYNPSVDFRLNGAVSATTNHGDVGLSLGASWTLN